MINVKNLVKAYDKVHEPAVKGVSFNIGKGEIVGLLGPNGAGKTTIMRMITCFMNPTGGEILVDGKSTFDDPIYIKNLIGYLPEHTPQYEDITVYEYLCFTAEVRGIPKEEIKTAVDKMIKLTELEKMVAKNINQLSKGYRKRVGLASVLIHDPKILILDEPTAGLDPSQVMTFRKMLRRLSEQKTIILSTHVLSEIEAICERVIIINEGNVVADDSIQDLTSKFAEEKYIDFVIEANNLADVEQELSKTKGAWKIEFVKKDSKNLFKFRGFGVKDSSFESSLKDVISKKGWKVTSVEKNNPNLEEIFLKLAGGEE